MTTHAKWAEFRALIGQELGVSEWFDMTQEKINAFTAVTGDRDWLHNDPERCAKESPFDGKTIVQGNLMLCHLVQMAKGLMPNLDDVAYSLNYGYDRVRIIRPVVVNSRIRGCLKLTEIRPKGENRHVVKIEANIEVAGSDGPHIVAEWLFFVQIKT